MNTGNVALSEVRRLEKIIEELLVVMTRMEQRITELENR